ncbi:MAG: dUTP diphosphatase [Pseudomonadota bacterium]
MTATLTFKRLPHAQGLDLPAYETAGAAGMDVRAALPEDAPLMLEPGARALVPTGLVLGIPEGLEVQVRPRSGLALRQGLTVLNAPGTVDADYRGEVGVLLVNLGTEAVTLRRGERVAQLVVAPVLQVRLVEGEPGASDRAGGGFGSTGV